ncbi:GNAT family N-acetyltransferase [Natrialba sp. PRR66]|uniref:GNAT family N-acetyltransferase n=1 Tax=Natrialba sp. PRR66 TaxID=3098146 RepID=UPI002B1DF57E|nr:GNAT family N-acetyltransferase [Natrialba sp. PRR66]
MVDYRPLSDQRAVFHEFRSYAFRPDSGVPPYEPDDHDTPRALRGSRRGIYESADAADDDPRSVCRHYWLDATVRGETHPIAGLASVATPPEFRRQGYVRELLANSLAEYREQDRRFSVLWPFSYGFYHKYGWETSNRIVTHEFDPEVCSFATAADAASVGSFRPVEADEFGELVPVYERHAERYALAIDRDEDWWRHRTFGGHDVDPYVYAFERDGRVAGYLVYTIDGDRGDWTMAVSELVAADHEAFLALLSFCHTHDSQVERVRLRLPADAPFREAVRAPDEVETTVTNGPMVRIVDVAEVLSSLSYPTSSETALTLSVTDPLAEWNDGLFELTVADGRARCGRVSETRDNDATADATLDIAALSELAVGTRSATDLARTNRLEAADREVVSTLAELVPKTPVYLGEFF